MSTLEIIKQDGGNKIMETVKIKFKPGDEAWHRDCICTGMFYFLKNNKNDINKYLESSKVIVAAISWELEHDPIYVIDNTGNRCTDQYADDLMSRDEVITEMTEIFTNIVDQLKKI